MEYCRKPQGFALCGTGLTRTLLSEQKAFNISANIDDNNSGDSRMFVVEDVFPILKHVLTPKLYTALQVVGIFTAMSLKAQLTALAFGYHLSQEMYQ